MARPDTTAQSALSIRVTRPVWFAYLDMVGSPIRASTLPHNVTLSSTDPELNGQTFQALNAVVQDFGEVHNQEGGSETLTLMLSGEILPDNALLNIVGDNTKWQGRVAKFWQGIRDSSGAFTGNIWLYHTGWMSQISMGGQGDKQFIQLQIEGYLAHYGLASGRTYMDQTLIDPNDLSPQLIGSNHAPGSGGGNDGTGNGGTGGGGGTSGGGAGYKLGGGLGGSNKVAY